MYKAFLLIVCLMVCTEVGIAQGPDTRHPAPSPARPEIRSITKEQLERVRDIARGTAGVSPTPTQAPSPAGREIRITKEQLDWVRDIARGMQSASAQPSPGISDLPEGFTHPLDGFSLDLNLEGFKERIDAATDGAIGALKQMAASNQPPVPSPALGSAVMTRNTEGLKALAASSSSKLPPECKRPQTPAPDVRCVIDPHGLYVRSDPGSFFVNTLKLGDHFRVKARRDILKVDPKTGEKHNVCYFYGDALGGLDLHNVWVNCDGLEKQGDTHPTPRPAVQPEFHKAGVFNPSDKIVTTRDHLYDRFAAPPIFPETPKGNDGTGIAEVKPEVGSTQVFRKYDARKRNDPITHGFSDFITTVYADPKIRPDVTLKVRYLAEGSQAAVVDYVVTNPDGTKSKKWGFVRYGDVNIILPPGPGSP